ncbi:cytochrome-c peroxidase [Aliidiomarina iranensis]|uniref:Cytochrome-c peroxidase n=1 Tax=Aliidiomarina iranensis TaxID=1434071 RepID=A0A432VZQ7_9GAMM|nr:cytochrome c peroxidase [Aliidiomarina iranensis]RUO22249.1 cytochrome-c peroxidase [Aliidiomarina iranensis]
MVKRFYASAALVCLSVLAWCAGFGVAPSLAAESELTQRYLEPQSKWPTLHENAHADVAALPEPLETNADIVQLGEQLFHDPGLSRDGSVSCASCHKSSAHFADTVRISPGVEGREGRRTSQMLRLAGHWDILFWDGRVANLEALVAHPVQDPMEMDSTIAHVESYVTASDRYSEMFQHVFQQPATWNLIAEAIAEFMRAVEHPPTRFDKFMYAVAEGDKVAAAEQLNAEERLGLHLFRTKAGCVQCHAGDLFSDQRMHNIGLAYYGRSFEDLGHYQISGNPAHVGAFRTPSLRYVGEREHLMHNGLFNDLLGIVRMYSHGGARPKPRGEQVNDPLFPETSELLQPFSLTKEEEQALVKFLNAL